MSKIHVKQRLVDDWINYSGHTRERTASESGLNNRTLDGLNHGGLQQLETVGQFQRYTQFDDDAVFEEPGLQLIEASTGGFSEIIGTTKHMFPKVWHARSSSAVLRHLQETASQDLIGEGPPIGVMEEMSLPKPRLRVAIHRALYPIPEAARAKVQELDSVTQKIWADAVARPKIGASFEEILNSDQEAEIATCRSKFVETIAALRRSQIRVFGDFSTQQIFVGEADGDDWTDTRWVLNEFVLILAPAHFFRLNVFLLDIRYCPYPERDADVALAHVFTTGPSN